METSGKGNFIANRYILWTLSRKEVKAMSLAITIDWKFVVALGAATVSTIFAVKMDASAAERVSTHVADACKEYAFAVNSER